MAQLLLRQHAAKLLLCFSQDEQWHVPCHCAALSSTLEQQDFNEGCDLAVSGCLLSICLLLDGMSMVVRSAVQA